MRYKLSLHNLGQPLMKYLSDHDRRAQIFRGRFIAGCQIHCCPENCKLALAVSPDIAYEYPPRVEADANHDGLAAEHQRLRHAHHVLCAIERLCSEIRPRVGISPD